MPEFSTEVQTYRYYCDKCPYEVGECKFIGGTIVHIGESSKQIHACENCGERYYLNRVYPYIDYKEVNDDYE